MSFCLLAELHVVQLPSSAACFKLKEGGLWFGVFHLSLDCSTGPKNERYDADSLLVQTVRKTQVEMQVAFSPTISACLRLGGLLVSIIYGWWRKGTTFPALFNCSPDLGGSLISTCPQGRPNRVKPFWCPDWHRWTCLVLYLGSFSMDLSLLDEFSTQNFQFPTQCHNHHIADHPWGKCFPSPLM